VRRVILDPQIIAAGFLDSKDRNGIYRLLGLLAYGRLCQYLDLTAKAEEDALRKTIQEDPRWERGGLSLDALLDVAAEQRHPLAEHLFTDFAPNDLVLVTTPLLLDELEAEVEHLRTWLHSPDYELAQRVRRMVGAMSFQPGDLETEPVPLSNPLNEMLHVGALSNAAVLSEQDAIAPPASDFGSNPDPREDTITGRPVIVYRLAPFMCWQVEQSPFSIDQVPIDLLDKAYRALGRPASGQEAA